jgi:MFS family permease
MNQISKFSVFRAFRSRNYLLYFIGRAVSQFGTWMQRTAVIWVVYSITHSAFMTGVAIFAEQFPSFLFSFAGGVAADRYDRFRIIRITQITSMIQAVLLALLVYTGHTVVWEILVLSVLLGIINAFDVPARQSLVHVVVADPSDLPNAVSLTTATASLAMLLGPALSGIVLSAWGASVCFLINAASFGGVMVSLILMKLPPSQPKKSGKTMLGEFSEGLVYVRKTPVIGQVILMVAIASSAGDAVQYSVAGLCQSDLQRRRVNIRLYYQFCWRGFSVGYDLPGVAKAGCTVEAVPVHQYHLNGGRTDLLCPDKKFPRSDAVCRPDRVWRYDPVHRYVISSFSPNPSLTCGAARSVSC